MSQRLRSLNASKEPWTVAMSIHESACLEDVLSHVLSSRCCFIMMSFSFISESCCFMRCSRQGVTFGHMSSLERCTERHHLSSLINYDSDSEPHCWRSRGHQVDQRIQRCPRESVSLQIERLRWTVGSEKSIPVPKA